MSFYINYWRHDLKAHCPVCGRLLLQKRVLSFDDNIRLMWRCNNSDCNDFHKEHKLIVPKILSLDNLKLKDFIEYKY